MAVASRSNGVGVGAIFISLNWSDFLPSGHKAGIGVVPSEAIWNLEGVERCQGGITATDLKFAVTRLVMGFPTEQLAIVITDRVSGNTLHVELLSFHQSFFVPFFDFATSERLPPFIAPTYEKPEFLAVFTHVYNEDDMLTMWEKHYSNLTPHRHLYVVDHGSTTSPRELLNGPTNVVSIPRGMIDHANISRFCNYFQRFLLTQYRWVIHVDCDEFLICEGGMQSFLTKLDATEPGVIIRPKHAYDLVHDYRSEPPLTGSEPISTQRSILKTSPAYRKPALGSVPTTWMLGFHVAFETYLTVEEESLWMIHLAFVDLERNLGRQIKWKNSLQSRNMYFPGTERPGSLEELMSRFDILLQSEGIEFPQWMRGMF